MRIKRLDITGFKSFMDRVVFSFDDGITGVVGPNGCGKSNVVDAIRWSMGEQSAKNLRGRGMEDVIFNGSETHPPLSMAEVTLTFAVGSHDALPSTLAGLPEVSVTRRLFRSGESEYQINKTTCRLLDITELFLGTGVGTRAYSIIEQGRVGQIVSARPEDRRSFLEEAAGITRYKARRKAAERKLEYTRANLLRVNDIVAELDRRLAALDRQAKRAEKYQRLKGEIRDLELAIFANRFQALGGRRLRVSAELEQLSRSEQEASATAELQEAELAARREALAAGATTLEARTQALLVLESQARLEAQSVLHVSDDQAAAQERVQAVEAELRQLEARRLALGHEQADADLELSGLAVSSREDEVLVQVKEEEFRRALSLQGEIVRRVDDERGQVMVLATRIANHLGTLATLEQRSADAAARGQQLDLEVATLGAEEAQLESARREVLDRVEQHRMVTVELTQRRGAEEDTLSRVREAFAENEVMVTALREDLADKKSRLSSLEEIAHNYEGYDRGVRAVMAQLGAEPRKAGVFGVVSDVLTAPPELEKAIEAALGERLQHIVVETTDRAYELVEDLRALAEGRSTFLPVPAEGGLPALVSDEALPSSLGRAVDRVTIADPVLRPVVEVLLAGVVIVEDLAAARAASQRDPRGIYVTLEGEVVRPGGVVTGGALEGPGIGALQKRRQIAELTTQVAHLEERYNEIITRHYELQKQLGHSESVLKGLERNRHQEELSLTGHEKDLHQAGSSLARLRERIAQLSLERRQVEGARAGFAFDAEAARGEAAHAQAERAMREERVRLMGSELETLHARIEGLQVELTALKVKVASVTERGEAARLRVESLALQAAELSARLQAREHARLEDLERVAILEGKLRVSAEALPARVEAIEGARREAEALREAHAQLTRTVSEAERAFKELRSLVDTLAAGRAEAAIKDRELELELDHLTAQVQERHQVTMAETLVLRQHAPVPDETSAQTLEELKLAVDRLGEVNLTAIEEHRELSERHRFLSGQQRDLDQSLDRLARAIEKIDATSRARFQETFDIVNQKFQHVFPRLFGGGRASLTLVQGAAGEEPGVEILAQPPGKKLQSVNLFSGGEKALTAVALIFAIFLIKPTPFCLLDEVDAPLDEGNVGRYNEMVREMSQGSQFILITHNKRTMEVVDALYGVTMEEPGVSKLVSVKLKDATAANTDQQVA